MDFDEILRSSVRQKILFVLSKNKELGIMALVRLTSSNYFEVNRHLGILGAADLVSERKKGRMRLFSINGKNPQTQIILEFLRILNVNYFGNGAAQTNKLMCSIQHLEEKVIKISNERGRQKKVFPDALSLLKLPKLLRVTVLALYEIVDKATVKEIAAETKRTLQEEKVCANRLVKLGYIQSVKEGKETYFFIESPVEEQG